MIFGVTTVIVLGHHKKHWCKITNLMDKCLCSDFSIYRLFPISLLRPPYSLRHKNIAVRPINNPRMASKCLSEKKSYNSHFKSKARNDDIKWGRCVENEERLKARPLGPNSQVKNAMEKFFKGSKSAAPGNTWIIQK